EETLDIFLQSLTVLVLVENTVTHKTHRVPGIVSQFPKQLVVDHAQPFSLNLMECPLGIFVTNFDNIFKITKRPWRATQQQMITDTPFKSKICKHVDRLGCL